MDFKAQVSMEYLLIFFISIIILSTISLPFMIQEIDTIEDTRTCMEAKSMLVEVADNIQMVYSSDIGTKKNIAIKSPCSMNISYRQNGSRHYLYTYIKLSNNTHKWIGVEVPCQVSFTNKPNYSYTTLKNNWWYYNTEVKWLESNNTRSVNVYFK